MAAKKAPAVRAALGEFDGGYSVLVNYLAVCAWASRSDCVVVDAASLRVYFGLDRLPDDRVALLQRCARSLFPFQERVWENPENNSNVELYLSRSELPAAVFRGALSSAQRMELLALKVPTSRVHLSTRSDILRRMRDFSAGAVSTMRKGSLSVERLHS